MKIAIITDGDNQLGLGHIYQSIVLAGLLSQKLHRQSEIFFLTKSGEKVRDLITSNGFVVYHCPDDNEILSALKNEKPDRIIFDKIDVSPDLARKIKKEIGAKLIIFTNLTEANRYADITIKADFGNDFKNVYKKDEIAGQVEFFGPKFWLLRPEFYGYKKNIERQTILIRKIMLIFGGADPSNFSSTVLNELLKMDTCFTIKLVLGAAFLNQEELKNVIVRNHSTKSTVLILENVKNTAEIMHESDVVFVSPGLSFFEALAVGTPVVGFHQDDCQRDWYKGFLTTFGPKEVFKTPFLIETKDFIYPLDPFIRSMEIGEGKDEVINEILGRSYYQGS